MRTIGFFTRDEDGFIGRIDTLSFQHKAVILPRLGSQKKHSSDYMVYADGVELGEAWRHTNETGKVFLTLRLDDPSFCHRIDCQLVSDDKRLPFGNYRLVWSR